MQSIVTYRVRHLDENGYMIDGSGSFLDLDEAVRFADKIYESKNVGFSNQVEVFRDGHTLEVVMMCPIKTYK